MQERVDVGAVISRAFSIYGAQAGTLLPLAFAVFLVVGVLQGVLTGALVLIATLVSLVAGTLYSGMVVRLVEDVEDGRRDWSAGELIKSVTPVLVPLILAGLLVGVMAVVGFILLIVPGLLVLTFFAVTAPAIVVERLGVMEGLRRSRELVKGHAWPVFGVLVITILIVIVVNFIFGVIAGAAGNDTAARIIATVIASTVTAPISALVGAVLYFTLRGSGAAPGVGPTADATGAPAGETVPGGFAPPSGGPQSPPPPPPPASGPQSPAQ